MHQNSSPTFAGAEKWLVATIFASMAFMSLEAAAAQDREQGMLLLHSQAQSEAVDKALPSLTDQGCALWRRGSIAGAQGNLDIGSPDRFVIMVCTSDNFESAQHREALTPILRAGKGARLVEGPIQFSNSDKSENATQDKGAYIVKLSRYTNLDPNGMKRDFDAINALAEKRTDAWKTDAFISGFRAVGMPTPDEAAIIHYDDPQQGDRFRSQNPDILKLVGAFNKKHLIEYTYISMAPNQ